jgi:hypothetical protein
MTYWDSSSSIQSTNNGSYGALKWDATNGKLYIGYSGSTPYYFSVGHSTDITITKPSGGSSVLGVIAAETNDTNYFGALLSSSVSNPGLAAGNRSGGTSGNAGDFYKSYGTSYTSFTWSSIVNLATYYTGATLSYYDFSAATFLSGQPMSLVSLASASQAASFTQYGGNGSTLVQSAFTAAKSSNMAAESDFCDGNYGIQSYAYLSGKTGSTYYGLYAAVSSGGSGYVGYNGYSFYAVGYSHGTTPLSTYSIAGYGPFTGSHDAFIAPNTDYEFGDIVIDIQVLAKASVSDAVTLVALSTTPNQPSVVGVISAYPPKGNVPGAMAKYVENITTSTNTVGTSTTITTSSVIIPILDPKYQDIYDANDLIIINSLGEGLINVCGEGGNIEAGDYITSSSIPGKGMKQADDLMHNYTVAKARESYTFTGNEIYQLACSYHCG